MKFAYADPPYLGLAAKFYGHLHPEAAAYDKIDAHVALVERLCDEYSDGWAMSMTTGNLHDILPIVPKTARVMAWVKPFASFKPGVGVAYAWEPVIVMGGAAPNTRAAHGPRLVCGEHHTQARLYWREAFRIRLLAARRSERSRRRHGRRSVSGIRRGSGSDRRLLRCYYRSCTGWAFCR